MMKPKRKRLYMLLAGLAALGLAAGLILNAFRENILFFYSPTDIVEQRAPQGRALRVGGLVEKGSVERGADATVHFRVTDLKDSIPVTYTGMLPDLFREGQGVVAEGKLGPDGGLQATSVLAKHDERYMPPEVVQALKKAGRWQEEEKKP
jgi:cytochrome c-type biogenesis protein CcmE